MVEQLNLGMHEQAAIVEGKTVERNFDVLNTHLPGFFLLVEHGEEPDMSRSQTRNLRDVGDAYLVRSETIKSLQKLQKVPHEDLVSLAINNPGLRGGRDMNDGIEVQITPKTADIFDEYLLDQSLGEKGAQLVHKKVKVSVELDPETDDVSGFIKSIKRRLNRQGTSGTRLRVETTLRVDTKELTEMLKAEQIALLPGTWGKQVIGWDVVPRRIKSSKDLKEAEEKANLNLTS